MNLYYEIRNCKGNSKGLAFIICFRISQYFTRNIFLRIIGLPFRLFYKFIFEWIIGIDIKDTTKIGVGFIIWHGFGIVVESSTVIGCNVTIRQNTTIGGGRFDGEGKSPVIGDNVQIGANCLILGPVTIGNYACIGAGAVVLKNVPDYAIVAGNPAIVIKYVDRPVNI